MSSKKYFPVYGLSHRRNRIVQPGAIALGLAGERRSEGLGLAEGQVAAQDRVAVGVECLGKRDEQRSRAIAARAVSKDHAIPARITGVM